MVVAVQAEQVTLPQEIKLDFREQALAVRVITAVILGMDPAAASMVVEVVVVRAQLAAMHQVLVQ
jgi:hypothetical protein